MMDYYTFEINRDGKEIAYFSIPVDVLDIEGSMKFTDDTDEVVREITTRIYFEVIVDKAKEELESRIINEK